MVDGEGDDDDVVSKNKSINLHDDIDVVERSKLLGDSLSLYMSWLWEVIR